MGRYKNYSCKCCGGRDFRICDQKITSTQRNKIYKMKALVCKECYCRSKWITKKELETINLDNYK